MIFFKHVWILMVMQKPSLSACEVTEAGWIKYVPNTIQRLRDGLGSTRCVPSTPPGLHALLTSLLVNPQVPLSLLLHYLPHCSL